MKKYLSWFLVLAMFVAVALNTEIAKAEERGPTSNSGGGNVRPPISGQRETRRAEFEAKMKELKTRREAAREEMGVKRDVLRKEIEVKREEIKTKRAEIETEIKIKREELKRRMDDLKTNLKKEKDQTRAKIKEERIVGRERALEVFDDRIEKLSGLKDKVNAQMTRLEAKGVDTIKAESLAATAEIKLNDARTKITEINALLAVSTEQISAEDKVKLKTLKEETQTLLRDAHSLLKNAVKSLRDALKEKRDSLKKTEAEKEDEKNN